MRYTLLLLALVVSACGYQVTKKEQPREVPKPYVEREVLSHQGGAFNSCPPAHAKEGRC